MQTFEVEIFTFIKNRKWSFESLREKQVRKRWLGKFEKFEDYIPIQLVISTTKNIYIMKFKLLNKSTNIQD